jgi:hypothetical protein
MMAALDAAGGELQPLCMRLRVTASPEHLGRLRSMLADWVDAAQELDESNGDDDAGTAGVLIAFYPLGTTPPSK